MSQVIPTYLLDEKGQPISSLNPLPTSGGGGGGGTVDQGKAGSAPQSWYIQDGSGLLATAAKQDTGNTALSNILSQLDSKTSTLATASAQTTGNTSLATIATQQTDGTQKTQVTSSVLPSGAATAAKQPALGTAGTPSADVLSVQGVPGGTPQPISASSLPLPTGAATSALQGGGLPAALVGGRLDSNVGAWLGSTAPSVGQKTAANSLPVVLASDTGTLTVATNVTPGSTVGETFLNCSTAQILLAATAVPKVRKIYNRAGNGRLFIRYGSAPTAETDCNFAVEPGSSWEMPVLAPGVLEYAGNVYGLIPSGASTAHGLQVT